MRGSRFARGATLGRNRGWRPSARLRTNPHRALEGALSDTFDLSELLGDFRDEAHGQLALLDEALLALERGAPLRPDGRTALLRALHTLKGNAAMLGFRPVQALVHAVEGAFKGTESTGAAAPLPLLHQAAAALRRAVDRAGGPDEAAAFAPLPALTATVAAAPASFESAGTSEGSALPAGSESAESASGGSSGSAGVAGSAGSDAAADAASGGSTEADSARTDAGTVDSRNAPSSESTEAAPDEAEPEARDLREDTIRIPFTRLDALLNQVAELARVVDGLADWAAIHRSTLESVGLRRPLAERVESLAASASTVRRGAAELRLVPVARIFARFPALAADLARARGKRVRVVLEGQGTELDKSTADALLEPLLHLVRNAVDHGVETPAERAAAGKDEEATIWLRAAQEGDRVRIEVEDDGRGLDREAVVARARERGLLAADDDVAPGEAEELVFRPGFSTRTEADEVSGRGIGLDVVRTTIAALRGSVELEEADEGGTRFVLHLPLTLAMVPVLFFRAAGETLAIPALEVEEALRAGPVGRIGPAETVEVRGEALPLVRPGRVFGWTANGDDPRFVLVVRRGTRAAALGADRLLAQRPAAVRALPRALGTPRGVSGATVDAGGHVVLLLDPEAVLEMNVDLYRGGARAV